MKITGIKRVFNDLYEYRKIYYELNNDMYYIKYTKLFSQKTEKITWYRRIMITRSDNNIIRYEYKRTRRKHTHIKAIEREMKIYLFKLRKKKIKEILNGVTLNDKFN